MDEPAREPEPHAYETSPSGVLEVASRELARTRGPVYCRGAGWLAWRHEALLGVRVEGPRWVELLPRVGATVGHLEAAWDGPIDLLIDAGDVRLEGGGGSLLEAVADALGVVARRLCAGLRRVALVAPSDWSTPWWHGLPLLVDTRASWRTFSSWHEAYAWLDDATPIRAEVARLITRRPSELLLELERTLRQRPSCELSTVARLMGVSRRTLQRLLAREGVGFHAIRTGIRLERARALLLVPHVKISAVSREVGFASTGHFILWFRRHHGTTPGVWRAGSTPRPDVHPVGDPK